MDASKFASNENRKTRNMFRDIQIPLGHDPAEHTLLNDALVKRITLILQQSPQDALRKKMEHQGLAA